MVVSYDRSVRGRPTDFDTLCNGRRKLRSEFRRMFFRATECLCVQFEIRWTNKQTNKYWPHSYLCTLTHTHSLTQSVMTFLFISTSRNWNWPFVLFCFDLICVCVYSRSCRTESNMIQYVGVRVLVKPIRVDNEHEPSTLKHIVLRAPCISFD